MTEYIKTNARMVHITSEILCLVILFVYVKKSNNDLISNLKLLHDRLYQSELVIKKHESMLNDIFARLGYVRHHTPKPMPEQRPVVVAAQSPFISEDDESKEVADEDIVEDNDDYLDSIIADEISKFD